MRRRYAATSSAAPTIFAISRCAERNVTPPRAIWSKYDFSTDGTPKLYAATVGLIEQSVERLEKFLAVRRAA